jgi:hypothetical protein
MVEIAIYKFQSIIAQLDTFVFLINFIPTGIR